jgi:ABC-2 type transport system permease protein
MTGTTARTPGLASGPLSSSPTARTPHGVATVYRWEMEKLAALLRVRLAAAACFLAPFGFAAALRLQDAVPADTLFGRWTHFSGFATPMVLLVFCGQWALPLLTCLVAGDIFAAEDRYGTWKMITTRSCTRVGIFWGKALAAMTFAAVTVALLALGGLTAGILVIGTQPLVSLSGTLIPPGQAAGLVLASWTTALPPTLAFTAMGLLFSIATRNGPAGILGPGAVALVMQLLTFVNGVDVLRHLLLTTPYGSWHGLMSAHHYYAPMLRGAGVSAVYLAACLTTGALLLRRRDFEDG